MREYKAGWRYYFFLVFFSLASVLGIRVIWMLLGGEVLDGDEEMSRGMAVTLSILMGLAFSTYIETSVVLLWQLQRFHGTVLAITDQGIENTLVYVNVLAFVFVFPVKLIPWNAVKYADLEDELTYIRLNAKSVEACGLAKLILWILGYQFCLPFAKPKVSSDDVKRYAYQFAVSEK